MAHEIDFSNGRANVAYLGSRDDVWHHLGFEMPENAPQEEWLRQAGLQFLYEKNQAYTLRDGVYVPVPDQFFIARNDTGVILSDSVTEDFALVQPRDVLAFFYDYISVDSRFQMDVAGSLRGGATVWATAKFNGTHTVGGSEHVSRALLSTGGDGHTATFLQGTETRTVCKNTLRVSLADKRAQIRIPHVTAFDPKEAARKLAALAKSFDTYKAMGDAFATVHLAQDEIEAFFRTIVDLPRDAKRDAEKGTPEHASTRKWNMLDDIHSGYEATIAEGTDRGTAWTALNAVTNYADHIRGTRNTTGVSEAEARFTSANFGTGVEVKATAWNLLAPLVKGRVAIAA